MKNKRPPTNTEALQRLNNKGYHVKIQHYRMVPHLDDWMGWMSKLTPDNEWRKFIDSGYYDLPDENGGASEIILDDGEQKIVTRATCYHKDRFCRRLGVSAVLKKLKELHSIEA